VGKYYFKKPRSEISKDILDWLVVGGAVMFAATSPYFGINLIKSFSRWKKYKSRNVYDAFGRLRKQGCIDITIKSRQVYINLTEKGKKMAGWLQIDALRIQKPRKWDRRWRIVIFDIAQLKKMHREAFRGKLKTLGFYLLQKSVWVCPFNCKDEIELLRSFFGLNESELRFIVAEDVGSSEELRKFFKI